MAMSSIVSARDSARLSVGLDIGSGGRGFGWFVSTLSGLSNHATQSESSVESLRSYVEGGMSTRKIPPHYCGLAERSMMLSLRCYKEQMAVVPINCLMNGLRAVFRRLLRDNFFCRVPFGRRCLLPCRCSPERRGRSLSRD
jgi:hypothetical protein